MKRYLLLFCIVLIAGFLRFYHLSLIPPALNSDEVAIGYNAYSILKTGMDEYGNHLPLTFRSFDDYKMPVYVYMVSGVMAIAGKSDFAVRFPSALFGTLTVLFTFFLVKELFRQTKVSEYVRETVPFLSAALLTISPWHLMFSRAGFEANVSVFFVVLGVYCFFLGIRRGMFLILSAISFALAIWTYHTCKIFVPLLVFGLAVFYLKDLWKQRAHAVIAFVFGVVLLFPIIKMTISVEGQMRARGVSAFSDTGVLERSVNWMVVDTQTNQKLFTVFHNRRIEYAYIFLRGYFSHFDLNFLFLDKAIDRYRAPGVGLMYLVELPFFFVGLYWLFYKRTKNTLCMLYWILAAPVAAAFTLQFPHPVRTIVFLPMLQIITALGLSVSLGELKKVKMTGKRIAFYGGIVLVVLSFFINGTYFFHQYIVHMPVDNAASWYVGRKEMVQKLSSYKNDYDRILVSNALDFPYIFFLYYTPANPSMYLAEGGTVSGGFKEEKNKFGKYEFRSVNPPQLSSPQEKILYVGLPGEKMKTQKTIDTIYYSNGTPAIIFFK